MSLAAQIVTAHALAQSNFEAAYPATLTIAGTPLACARGTWRNSVDYDQATGTESETRSIAVRVRKSLVSGAGLTLVPETTDATFDGILCRILSITSIADAFHLTLAAVNPATVQA